MAAWTLVGQYGDDMIMVDPTFSMNLTLTTGEEERSLDMIAIPMSLEGVAGKLSFTRLDELGLALLGMRYMHGIDCGIGFRDLAAGVINALNFHFVLPHAPVDICNHSAVAQNCH